MRLTFLLYRSMEHTAGGRIFVDMTRERVE